MEIIRVGVDLAKDVFKFMRLMRTSALCGRNGCAAATGLWSFSAVFL